MRDQQDAHVRVEHGVHALGHDPQGIDVQAGIGLVEDRHLRLEDRHLEHFQALLLAAGEPLVHVPGRDRLVHLEQGHLLADELAELAHRDPALERVGGVDVGVRVQAEAVGVDGRPQEARHREAGDGHRVLEGEEHAEPGPLVDRELQEILALPEHLAGLDHVRRVAHQGVGEGRLARAVGAHDGVDLALPNGQVDPLEDLVIRVGNRGDVEVADDEVLVAHGRLDCSLGRGWQVQSAMGAGVGAASVRAPRIEMSGRLRRAPVGTRSASDIESRAPMMASRTRTHMKLTVQ